MAARAAGAIRSPDNATFVSAASVWEAEIKVAHREAPAPVRPRDGIRSSTASMALPNHARLMRRRPGRLPLHHGDPCDRMLVAQAQLEGLTIVTRDPVFDNYAVAVLKA